MDACPLERMKRSRPGQWGLRGLYRRYRSQSTKPSGARAIGVPGCPLLAFCTASMESVRMVLMQRESSLFCSGVSFQRVDSTPLFSRSAVTFSLPCTEMSTWLLTRCRLSAAAYSLGCLRDVDRKILALPIAVVRPIEGEVQGRGLRFCHLDVDELHSHCSGSGCGVLRGLPFVIAPMERERRRSLHAQQASGRNASYLPIHLPHFDYRTRVIVAIPLRHRLD